MMLRLLNVQGMVGIAASLVLATLLLFQKGETRHWKKQSAQYEQLYRSEQAAFATTVANHRAATESARAADRAAAQRVAAEQRAINERTNNDLEARLADARARADRLRVEADRSAADPGNRGSTPVPRLPAPAAATARSAGEDRLPLADALTATEQAIQLDELIKWVKAQARVDPNRSPAD